MDSELPPAPPPLGAPKSQWALWLLTIGIVPVGTAAWGAYKSWRRRNKEAEVAVIAARAAEITAINENLERLEKHKVDIGKCVLEMSDVQDLIRSEGKLTREDLGKFTDSMFQRLDGISKRLDAHIDGRPPQLPAS